MPVNQVNFGAARVMMAAIQHTSNNTPRFRNIGAILALRSLSNQQILQALDPINAAETKALGWKTVAGRDIPIPVVTLQYRPRNSGTAYNERATRTDGQTERAGASVDVKFDMYKETALKKTISSKLVEPNTVSYAESLLSGKLDQNGLNEFSKLTGLLGLDLYQEIGETLYHPLNVAALTKLVAAIGKNAAFPTVVTPTAAAPIVQVTARDVNGNPTKALYSFIRSTKLSNKFEGRPLVIGGAKLAGFLAEEKIYAINVEGLRIDAVYANTEFDFYYDEDIDTVAGADVCLCIEGGATTLKEFNYHGSLIDVPRHANTAYGTMTMKIAQFNEENPLLQNTPSMFSMNMDVRATESVDAQDMPKSIIVPSIACGIYTRPLGYLSAVTGDIMKDTTGIYAFKLVDAS